MRSTCFIFLALLPWTAILADEPQAETPGPAFWLAPRVDLDLGSLSPAAVKLVAAPDTSRELALLPTRDACQDYFPPNRMLEPFIPKVDTGYRVVVGGLEEGALAYGDRKYKIHNLDASFAGFTLLQTKNGHKAILDGRYSIVLSAAKPCYVFVAVDERALRTYKTHGTPSWLQEYAPTGHKCATNDPIMGRTAAGYLIFVRQAPAGRIALGPPSMDVDLNSMYFAFFAEKK
jgi:hypothetical protein